MRVEGTDLVLSIVRDASGRWTSAEVDNQRHLGYGTYRWVVASDLSALDANEVLGMFTYGGSSPSNNEIDIEPSHWGNVSWPTGSVTVWQDADAGLSQAKSFNYTSRPPYVNQFTWLPGSIRYLVTDAAGAVLLDWTVTSGVPTPSSEVPIVNYWRFDGVAPAAARSVRISSFTWLAPGQEGATPPVPVAGGAASGDLGATVPTHVRGGCPIASPLRLAMRPKRFAVTGRRRGTSIRWTARRSARLRLVVQRRSRGHFVTVGALKHSVRKGAGRLRFAGRAGGHRLRPGAYRLLVRIVGASMATRCAPKPLRFTVIRR